MPGGHAMPRTESPPQTVAPAAPIRPGRKVPFDVTDVMRRLRAAVADKPKPVLFDLAERGYGSPFEILVACVITIRTLEEVSLPTSLKLFGVARTPQQVAKLTPGRIDELIHACTFHGPKAKTIHGIATRVVGEFGGELPCDFETLTSFSG